MKSIKLSQTRNRHGVEIKLVVKHGEINECSEQEFVNFYEGTGKKLGCTSPRIENGTHRDGRVLIFSGCKTPKNL